MARRWHSEGGDSVLDWRLAQARLAGICSAVGERLLPAHNVRRVMSFLRKGILVSGVQVLGVPLTMLVGIIFSRALGPDGMGQYSLFLTTSTLAVTLAALGVGNANIYFHNNRGIATELITTNTVKAGMLLGLFLTIALTGAVLLFSDYFGQVSRYTAVLFALGAAMSLNTNILRPILVAQLATRRIVSVDLSRIVVLLLGAGVVSLSPWISPDAAIIVLSLSKASCFVVVLMFLLPHIQLGRRFEWRLFGEVVAYGLKLMAANLMHLLSGSITVMLLPWLRPDGLAAVGLYTRAVAMSGLITLVPMALGPLLYAKWAGATGAARTRQVEMAARMNLAYGVIACGALVLLGKHILWFLYGREFIPAQDALEILAPALIFASLFGVCNNLLAADGRALLSAVILAISAAIVATVTCLAAPDWGIRGAALGVLCGNGFAAVASLLVCRRLYGLSIYNCLMPHRSDLEYVHKALLKR